LRDYGEDGQLGLETTYQEYIDKLVAIFDEVKRVLKSTGTCWVNLGDTYSGMKVGNTENVKNPNVESASFIKPKQTVKDKSLIGIPERFAIAMTDSGWIRRNTIIWHKPSCMPSSATDRFTVDFEYLYFFTKNTKYYFEQQKEKTLTKDNSNRDRDISKLNNTPGRTRMAGLTVNNYEYKNKRCVWSINPQPYSGAHFASYPEELVATPIKDGCPKGGTVLDPFMGSGTTLKVARDLGCKCIGIELNPHYIELAEKRINLRQEIFAI